MGGLHGGERSRTISPDNEGINFNNPQSLNRYTYCLNNPLNRTDPTGHWPNWGAIWHGACEFAKGVGDSILQVGQSFNQLCTNPAKTVTELSYALTHPLQTIQAIGNNYLNDWSTPRGCGKYVGDILLTFGTIEASGALKNALDPPPALPTSLPKPVASGVPSTPLFRAVKYGEWADLKNTDMFRNLGQCEGGKYFSLTEEGAISYAKGAFQRWGDSYTIVQTSIPKYLLTNDVYCPYLDAGVPSVLIPNEMLPSLAPPGYLPTIIP